MKTTTESTTSPDTGGPVSSKFSEVALEVNGMNCASCVAHVERAAGLVSGVQACQVNLARGRAVVQYDASATDPATIAQSITNAGYETRPQDASESVTAAENERVHHQHEHAQAWLRRAVVGIALWLPVELTHWILMLFGADHGAHAVGGHVRVHWIEWLALASSTIALVYVGSGFYRNAWNALKRGTTDMDTLIAMGSSVAYGYSLVSLAGYLLGWWGTLPSLYFMEASGLLALISLGHWLEARARASAGRAIHDLLNLAPATAQRLSGLNDTEEVPVSELKPGDRVLVRPGDRVPIDGIVFAGRSSVDESMISGESLPVPRGQGDEVIGGTINHDGALRVRVTKTGSQTALAQIVKLVEHAQSTKPAVQRLADRISAVFVPSVLGIALVTGIAWYIFGRINYLTPEGAFDAARTWGAIARAVCSVLIIACPCALGLAVPATLMVGTGRGARMGILFRDIDALQSAEQIDTVVLDKTGTLTKGKPTVAAVEPLNGFPEPDLLRLAASAEQFSEHPLARAIVSAARDRGLKLSEPSSFTNEAGLGVIAQVESHMLLVGSEELLEKHGNAPERTPSSTGYQPVSCNSKVEQDLVGQSTRHGLVARATGEEPAQSRVAGTRVVVARRADDRMERIGYIMLADELKDDSRRAVGELHAMGLRTVLLSGDNRATAELIACQVGIDDVRADVRPDGKAEAIRALQNPQSAVRNPQSTVAMVGDGINDAPALAQADLGIAIGSGSDIAKETGGIVLVGGSLHGVAASIRLSRATMRKIRQNLFLAFIYNVLAIPLAAFGLLNPLIAAGAMALSDVTVIGNALLLRRAKLEG